MKISMKTTFTLKSLSVFTFVIFFLPFMRTCSDDSLKSIVKKEVNISDESMREITRKEIAEQTKEFTFNFYTLSTLTLKDFKLDNLSDKNFYPLFGLTIVLFLSILILILSFKNKFKTVNWLSTTNLIILLLSTLIFCLTGLIEKINQMKIGYYLFVTNSILITYLSKKHIHQIKPQKE